MIEHMIDVFTNLSATKKTIICYITLGLYRYSADFCLNKMEESRIRFSFHLNFYNYISLVILNSFQFIFSENSYFSFRHLIRNCYKIQIRNLIRKERIGIRNIAIKVFRIG